MIKCRIRSRVSWWAILTAAIITILATLLVLKSLELQRTRADFASLRARLGELDVTDPDMVHVSSRPTDRDGCWCWRLFIPRGARYKLCLEDEILDVKGSGRTERNVRDVQLRSSDGLENGFYTIDLVLHSREIDGRAFTPWYCSANVTSDKLVGRIEGFYTGQMGGTYQPWTNPTWKHQTKVVGVNDTALYLPNEEVSLFELRCAPNASEWKRAENASPRVRVYLAPVQTP